MDMFCDSAPVADLTVFAQAGVGLWIWSVWSWRLRMETSFRGGGAKNLVQEFQTYGYPMWVFQMVGVFKTTFSGMLVASIVLPNYLLTMIGACGMVFLMVVAIASHFKVGDELSKNGAACAMLILSSFTLCVTYSTQTADCFETTWSSLPESTRYIIGGCVALCCFLMWLRSFLKGDYNLDNYESLPGC